MPERLNMRGLRGLRALTPSVQVSDTSGQATPGNVVQFNPNAPSMTPAQYNACPPGNSCGPDSLSPTGILACAPPMIYFKDPNQVAPGCMYPTNLTLGPGGTATQGGTSTYTTTAGGPGSPAGSGGGGITPSTPPTSVVAQAPGAGILPKGQGNVSNVNLGAIYRFILPAGNGYATGASRVGCSQANSSACDPQFFNTLHEAIQYALASGEIPYQVFQASDPWAIINGSQSINPAQIYNADGSLGHGLSIGMLALLGIGAFLLFR